VALFGAALERLARAYQPDADSRLDLLQEIHVALWRSFASFDGRCSLRTWVYRVAHNVATSQVTRRRRNAPTLVGLDAPPAHGETENCAARTSSRATRRHPRRRAPISESPCLCG